MSEPETLPKDAQIMKNLVEYYKNSLVDKPEKVELFNEVGNKYPILAHRKVITERLDIREIMGVFFELYGDQLESNYMARHVIEQYYSDNGKSGVVYVNFIVYSREFDNEIIAVYFEDVYATGVSRNHPYHLKLEDVIDKMIRKRSETPKN